MKDIKTPFRRIKLGRFKTRDGAFIARMGAGFPGDVVRFENAKIEPCLYDPASVPLLPGMPVVQDNTTVNGVRALTAADTALTAIYGIVVRNYPTQNIANGLAAGFGPYASAAPIVDILRSGYIMVTINGSPNKGGPVYIWIAASSAPHVQNTFEAAATGGSTIALTSTNTTFQGPPDSNGVGELALNI